MELPQAIAFIVLAVLLVVIAIIDFRRQIIPDILNAALGLSGLATAIFSGRGETMAIIAGAFACLAVGTALAWAYRRFRGRTGLGGGDIKLLAAGAVWVGVLGMPWVLLIGSLSALAVAMGTQLAGKPVTATTRLAFGPHLALGLLVVWTWQMVQHAKM